ncbi:MAG: hypothetical protein K8S55_03215 [Phycisphaerae bacterium]|nr:hypothetical protein [Phycisphaerae bacterium]
MSSFCLDRDILAVEPIAYLGGGGSGQQIAAGSDGALSGTTFTSAGSDFTSAGLAAGMVLCVTQTIPAEGTALEIISVDSATALTVSVLRADTDADAIAPLAGTSLNFYVRTFAAQIANVSGGLAEKLRRISEAAGIVAADFADSVQLKHTAVAGVLAKLYLARADNARPHDANWIKAEYYRDEFKRMQNQLRLAVDIDGDGEAERTRTLGNVSLKRV